MVLSPPQASAIAVRDDFGAGTVLARIQGTVRKELRDGGYEVRFQALGTQCRWLLAGSEANAARFTGAALQWLAAFEAKYSRFLPGSLISRINAAAGRDPVAIDAETERIFALCQELHFLTRGIFDPTSLPLLALWNWKANPPVVPTEDQIESARQLVGWRQVRRTPGTISLPRPGMGLDLGGMGKEYAVDQISQLARQCGLTGALVDFGADIRVFGIPPDGRPGWHVGLEDPRHPGTCWRGLAVHDASVATSGDYHRKFEIGGVRYGHILDPRTGRPVSNGVRAVSVLAPTCTQAGLLSTSAFVLGPEEGIRLLDATAGVAGAILTDSQIHCSRRFHEHVAS
jgi:thiamine biosynthesis lipoprotein